MIDQQQERFTETMASAGVWPEQKRRINKARAKLIEMRNADREKGIVPLMAITIKGQLKVA